MLSKDRHSLESIIESIDKIASYIKGFSNPDQLNDDQLSFDALFEFNINNYPNSVSAYETMGDYYLTRSDTIKAIEFFSKAVKIGGKEISKDLIEKSDMLKSKN